MRYAGTDLDDREPWFRIGQLEVTTTVFMLLLWGVTLVVFALEPLDKPVNGLLALDTSQAAGGELWRLVTWPWSNLEFSLWDVISAAIFYIFGTELERQVGRGDFARLMGGAIVTIGVAGLVLSQLLGTGAGFAGMRLMSLTLILLYCAEHPTRPFFFGIRAWMIAAVIVALEVINDIAYRRWVELLTILVAAGVIAILARRIGLLGDYERIPALERGERPSRAERKAKRSAQRKARRSGLSEVEGEGIGTVAADAPRPRPRPTGPVEVQSADDLALDMLLDKIGAEGMESLTPQERQQLTDIQARRKKNRGG